MKTITSIIILLILTSCAVQSNKTIKGSSNTLSYVSPSDNPYEGNLVVEIHDNKLNSINNSTVFIYADNKVVSELFLEDTSIGVFNCEQKGIVVEVRCHGYQTSITKSISVPKDKAVFLEFHLVKE